MRTPISAVLGSVMLFVVFSTVTPPSAVEGDVLRAPLQGAAPDTIVGTIHGLDLGQGELRVMTGVGLAVRIIPLRITGETRATAAGTALQMSALEPGDIVRVVGGMRAEQHVAYTIERIVRREGAL